MSISSGDLYADRTLQWTLCNDAPGYDSPLPLTSMNPPPLTISSPATITSTPVTPKTTTPPTTAPPVTTESCPPCGGVCFTTAAGLTTTCELGRKCYPGGDECTAYIPTCATPGCPGFCSRTACVVGGTKCAKGTAFCTPTEVCTGSCGPSVTITTTATLTTAPSASATMCGWEQLPCPSGKKYVKECGWEYVPCKPGYTCKTPYGWVPGFGETGDCVRDLLPKKRRFVAGVYVDEE